MAVSPSEVGGRVRRRWPVLDLSQHEECVYLMDGLTGTPVGALFAKKPVMTSRALEAGDVVILTTPAPHSQRFPVRVMSIRQVMADVKVPGPLRARRAIEVKFGPWRPAEQPEQRPVRPLHWFTKKPLPKGTMADQTLGCESTGAVRFAAAALAVMVRCCTRSLMCGVSGLIGRRHRSLQSLALV